MATENWNVPIDKNKLLNLLPIDHITDILEKNPKIEILLDDEIRMAIPQNYNMSISTRAHNDNMESKLKKYYAKYHESIEYKKLMKISLPQIFLRDTLGLKRTIIGLHISKLNSQELFINDIVLTKNENLDGFKNGIFNTVLENIYVFAKEQGLKYISGHAADNLTFHKFEKKGFQADKRRYNRNDKLWELSRLHGAQVPFFKEI
ncbi:hypothetical protein [Bacillus albus]|uniref:hypothetical protein n=1 Tax=Bacillus albus TaxID=2026189 RepID=UPI0018A15E76|nr:hypothetical protein [Bacillus albus]MBF7155065.1 hypothetical protein [Bacillus albus]